MYQPKKLPSSKVKDVIEHINEYMVSHSSKRHSEEVIKAYEHGEWEEQLSCFEQYYIDKGENLHLISGNKFQLENIAEINKQTMKDLYHDFFGKDSDIRKELYELFPEACPICDGPWGYVETHLDHILPESVFPQYAVTPVNLVRTCGRCNHKKLAKVGKSESNQTINPYFKVINLTNKLSCKVYIKSNEFTANIHLKPRDALKISELEYRIIENFLETYQLLEVYNEVLETHLLPELINLHISRVYKRPSQDELKEVLAEQCNSINHDLITYEKKVTTHFLKYLLLTSLIEHYDNEIYRVFIEKVETRRKDVYG